MTYFDVLHDGGDTRKDFNGVRQALTKIRDSCNIFNSR